MRGIVVEAIASRKWQQDIRDRWKVGAWPLIADFRNLNHGWSGTNMDQTLIEECSNIRGIATPSVGTPNHLHRPIG